MKKFFKSKLTLLLALLMITTSAVVFTGCGNDKPEDNNDMEEVEVEENLDTEEDLEEDEDMDEDLDAEEDLEEDADAEEDVDADAEDEEKGN